MSKWFVFMVGLIGLMILVGCSGGSRATPAAPRDVQPYTAGGESSQLTAPGQSSAGQVSEEQYAKQQATSGQADVDPQTGLNRMVIYNATLNLIVKDTLTAIEESRKVIQEAGGYIAESNSYRDNELLRATMTARVPSEKLTETLEQLKKIALTVDSETLKGEDVTDQYTDLETRLRVDEARRDRYVELLKRAEKIEDVLAVQQRLDETIAQIEQTKGRMEYLSKSTAFATITIKLTPDALARPVSIGGWRPQGTARDAFETLLWVLRALGDILIWSAICVLPVGLILGVPLYFVFRWARRRLRKPKA